MTSNPELFAVFCDELELVKPVEIFATADEANYYATDKDELTGGNFGFRVVRYIAAQQAELRRLESKLAVLIVAAGAALDYFTDKADADLRDDRFRGNRESDLASELSEAIRKAKGERP